MDSKSLATLAFLIAFGAFQGLLTYGADLSSGKLFETFCFVMIVVMDAIANTDAVVVVVFIVAE